LYFIILFTASTMLLEQTSIYIIIKKTPKMGGILGGLAVVGGLKKMGK